MNDALKKRILAYNRQVASAREKASDADILIEALLALPYGQLKKIINDEAVVTVLKKYGYDVE